MEQNQSPQSSNSRFPAFASICEKMRTSCSRISSTIRSVGYRFHPTDEELVRVYLKQKLSGRDSLSNVISLPEINNLYQLEPWEISNLTWPSEIDRNDQTCYFFHRQNPCLKQQKRATKSGFWSITGIRKKIKEKKVKKEIGFKRTMTFYYKDLVSNKKKKENKTAWVMHEYHLTANLPNQNTILLYKLKNKEYKKADISNHEVQPSSPLQLPNTMEIHPQDEIEYQLSSTRVNNFNCDKTTNQQNIIVDKEFETIDVSNNEGCPSQSGQLPSNSENHPAECGTPEDRMSIDELLSLLGPFDQVDKSLDCIEFNIDQTSNQQNMVHDGGSNLPAMNMLSSDLSESDFDTHTDENHTIEDGILEIQDSDEATKLQAELAALIDGCLSSLTDCGKSGTESSNQPNMIVEEKSFNSAFIGMVSPEEPPLKRSRLDNLIMINL